MNLAISMQSLKNVFRFPFQDPRWKFKFLIGAILAFASSIIPIIPALPLMGYLARVMRAGARNDEPAPLPEWDNWGELFMDGLRQTAVLIIGLLPPALISFVGWMIYMTAVVSMPILQRRGMTGTSVVGMLGSFGIFFFSLAVATLLLLIAAVIFPPAMAHVAVTRSFGGLFQVGKWWAVLRKNFLGFQVALGIFGALYMLLMLVTQILYMTLLLCALIPFLLLPLAFYSGLVYYRLVGQAYGEVLPQPQENYGEVPPVVNAVEPSPAI